MGSGRPIKDLTGQRFGKLVVLRFHEVRNHQAYWIVQCDCGTIKTIRGRNLKETLSCGCLKSQAAKGAWQRRQKERKEELQRIQAERRRKDQAYRQMIYNQEAGSHFDDFWMFGHDGKAYWDRVTSSTRAPESPPVAQ